MIKFTDLQPKQNSKLRLQLDMAYERVMSSGVYVRGREVEAFEEAWAGYNGAKHCVSCGSGLDALQLVLRANEIVNYVRVPGWTAISTWSAVEAASCHPDANPYTIYNIVVHLYGQNSKDAINRYTIEDCAQAHGLKLFHGVSMACCWSFYPTKNLGAYGDGGAVTTNNEELADKLQLLRNHGCNNAINSRLDPLQAAFLSVKLKYLDDWNKQRQEFAALYLERLADIPGLILPDAKPDEAVWHQFVIRTAQRDSLRLYLIDNGIETMVHYPVAPHRALGYDYNLPYADEMARTVLSLPIAPHLTTAEVETVAETVKRYYEND